MLNIVILEVKTPKVIYLNILFIDETDGAVEGVQTFSLISFSLISQAKIVGFSLLYCSILLTTWGVATFGLEPPIIPGGLNVPIKEKNHKITNLLFISNDTI